MSYTKEELMKEAERRGFVNPNGSTIDKPEILTSKSKPTKAEVFKFAMERGLIKPRDDGIGFKIRTKFSLADTDNGRMGVLEDKYGKGNVAKINNQWMIRDDKGWNNVDESSLSWNDIADVAGDIPEVAGAVAGSVAGSGLASVPMAGVGASAGRGVKKILANLAGVKDNQTPLEIAKDLGESGVYGAGGQLLGLGLGKAIGKAAAPYAKDITPDALLRKQMAEQYGVELTPAQITQAKSLGWLENNLKNNFVSADVIDNSLKETQFKPFNKAVEDMKPTKESSKIGSEIRDSIKNSKQAYKDKFNKEYRDIANSVNKNIPITNINGNVNAATILKMFKTV